MIIDLTKFPTGHDQYYQFLEWLPTQFPPDAYIIEGGTWSGAGARCLGSRGHKVETYDPFPQPNLGGLPPNVTHIAKDIFDIEPEKIRACDFFYLDIDPHEGASEAHFYHHLKKLGFRGLLYCDDIEMNEGMKAFWKRIDLPKLNLGTLAHATSTGFVSFGPATIITPQT